jgi:alpha-tubulin suppressor-like RCC1 family protein
MITGRWLSCAYVVALTACSVARPTFDDTGPIDAGSDAALDAPMSDAGADAGCAPGACPRDYTQVAVGGGFACAVRVNGSVYCWGKNDIGQLGAGSREQYVSMPTPVLGLRDAVEIRAGNGLACARSVRGSLSTVACWGRTSYTRMGKFSNIPVQVEGITDAAQIAVGNHHGCVLHQTTHTVSCWGWNDGDRLGAGDLSSAVRSTPVDVLDITNIVEITAGGGATCARDSADAVWCWGNNELGQLGDSTDMPRASPVRVADDFRARALDMGAEHTCAFARGDNSLWCWGNNANGEHGTGAFGGTSLVPIMAMASVESAIGVSAGGMHTCVVGNIGYAKCWGDNYSGQLGDGTTVDRPSPARVEPWGEEWDAIETGLLNSCGLRHGRIRCWGENSSGQIGNGIVTDYVTTPTYIADVP